MKNSFVILFAILICNSTFAQNSEKMKNEKDSLSYAMGVLMANNLKSDNVAVEASVFHEAFEAVMNDGDLSMSMEEAGAIVKAHFDAKAAKAQLENKSAGVSFLAENGKKKGVTTLPTGLQYEVLTEGTGEMPGATDKVTVHYTGTLMDGTVFDSSVDRGEPATFGVNQVIAGWTEALQLMKKGSKWKLVIPSDLAYGDRGAGGQIGPDATLIFEVELIEINK